MIPPSNSENRVLPVSINQLFTDHVRNQPLLHLGATGAKVIELQKLLAHWNIYQGAIDGVFGTQLQQAVQTFQRRVFLPVNGIVDPLTWRSLYAGGPIDMPPLQKGSSGAPVKLLQAALQAAGQTTIVLDGQFGPQTEAAVRHFQRCRGLVADGIVGACTWLTLSKIPR